MRSIILLLAVLLISSAPSQAVDGKEQDSRQSGIPFSFFADLVAGPEKAEFELVLRNDGGTPLAFEFPTSQKYEITVYDASKQRVYQYSEGKAFAQAFETLKLKPQQSIRWKESWDYYKNGERVEPGKYTVAAKLKAVGVNTKPISKQSALMDSKSLVIPGMNPVFRKINVEGSNGSYVVYGEARPRNGWFHYSLEDGHNELVSETKVAAGSKYPEWKPFTIRIDVTREKLPLSGSLILNLYEEDHAGTMLHIYPVLLERFK